MALDIVFISYNEPNAEENWESLKERFPRALRVDGVEGIPEAFIEAARIAKTSHVWTVDADNTIKEGFGFSYEPEEWHKDYVHLWYAENPVNNLTYGYGGIKLWPRKFLRGAIADPFSVDFTLPMASNGSEALVGFKTGLKIWEDVASVTRFNTDPYNSYRAGYREGAKLMDEILNLKIGLIDLEDVAIFNPVRKNYIEAKERLKAWTTIGMDTRFGEHCIHGATDGADFAIFCSGDEQQLAAINDFNFIREQFVERYGYEPITRKST